MTHHPNLGGNFTIGGDLPVHRLGFGAMQITGRGIWGEPSGVDGARALLRRVVESGVNLIDTADSYGPEVSERLIGETLHPYPEDVVIATKGGLLRPGPGSWQPHCTPSHLRSACEESLKRLKVERIDLYQLHTVDRKVPLEESIGALKELQDEGKIRHVGVSNFSVSEIERARKIVEIVTVQNLYNLGDRSSEDVLSYCEREGIGFIPWYPLGSGDLLSSSSLTEVAKMHESTPAQIALAWLLHKSPVMLPIPGTSSTEHFEENLGAGSIELSAEEMSRIEKAGA
ncbi:MAG TPA: aldo/keto reductase [Actinomycetota bacterium]|nr:aldo/keto reductase [Actinomycetota bacterium]